MAMDKKKDKTIKPIERVVDPAEKKRRYRPLSRR